MKTGQLFALWVAVGVVALMVTPAQAENVIKKRTLTPRAVAVQTQAPIIGWAGQYRGTDPDPNIRFQLMRDQNLR